MRAYVLPYRVLFHDTMAYGSHHFLTNLKFQCLAREHYYFGEVVQRDQALHDGHLVLTREAYSINLAPVAVGQRVAILMTVEAFGERSVRLCFRVVHEDGRPVAAGYQTMIRVDRATGAMLGSPDWVRAACETIREPLAEPDLATRLHAGRVDEVFDRDALDLAAEVLRADLSPDGGFLGLAAAEVPEVRTAFVFPGQGSFDATSLRALATGPHRDAVAAADAITRTELGASLLELARAEHPERLRDAPALAQVAMVLTSVCAAEDRIAAGQVPDAVAGHSFGEIAALCVAGAFDRDTAVRLVCARTRALAALGPVGGMLAVLGDGELAQRTVASVADVTLAVVNHAEQHVFSGPLAALETAEARLAAVGLTTRRVRSPMPFHSPLLRPAVAPFAAAAAALDLGAPTVPVFSAIEGRWLAPGARLDALLSEQLVRPVDWPAAVDALRDAGASTLVECGGRPVLTALTRRVCPDPALTLEHAGVAPSHPTVLEAAEGEPIAVVGMGCVTANATDPDALWQAVLEGRSGLSDAAADPDLAADFLGPATPTPDKTTTLLGGFITGFEPAASLGAWAPGPEPTLLQSTFGEALVQARAALPVDPARTLVLVGSTADGHRDYDEALLRDDLVAEIEALGGTPAERDALIRRVTEVLDLPTRSADALAPHAALSEVVDRVLEPGIPVVALDAACASSLYAVDQAVRALRAGEVDLVLCGGAFAPGPANACLFSQFGGLSGTGSRPLDAGADGVVFGDGAAVLALRRLSDAVADHQPVHAVIRAVGTSSDGRGPSVTEPRSEGQGLALERAWAGLDPASAAYLEAHATSTPVGDTAELTAMGTFFGAGTTVGSIKALTGHTGWAAGAVSLIKAVAVLRHQTLPPQPVVTPSPALLRSGLRVHGTPQPWEAPADGPRRAGVSGFGFGGSNAHVIVEEPPSESPAVASVPLPRLVIVGLSRVDDPEGLPAGPRVLPDVVDALDPTHRHALHAAHAALPADWESLRERIGVVLGLPGKTHAGRRATLRLYRDRLARRLRVQNGVPMARVEALLERVDAVPATGPYTLPGQMPNVAAGRVASFFDLWGPTLVVDAGAETLPRTLQAAARSLREGCCDLVLTGVLSGGALVAAVTTEAEAGRRGWPVQAVLDVRDGVPLGETAEDGPHVADLDAALQSLTPTATRWLAWRGIAVRVAAAGAPEADGPVVLPPLLRAEPVLEPAPLESDARWERQRVLLVTDGPDAGLPTLRPGDEDRLDTLSPDDFDVVAVVRTQRPDRLGADPLTLLTLQVAQWAHAALSDGRLALGTVCIEAVHHGRLHPASGPLGGLVKAIARELPQATVRALVTDGDRDTGWAELVHELDDGPAPSGAEAVRIGGVRHRPVLRERLHLTDPDAVPLDASTVVIATGGGSGVTATLLQALKERAGMPVIVLGRSDPDAVDPAVVALDDTSFATWETDFYRDGVAAGRAMPELRRAFARLAADRETARTLAALRALPGAVAYARADLCDPPAVAAAIAEAAAAVGTPGWVIHGAGVQDSGALATKSVDAVRRTLQTKLGGLEAVLDAVDALTDVPPRVHLLGSVFSFLGNDGQHGYGAANETLHRLAAWRADDGFSAIAWPGWRSLGMTRGSEYAEVARSRRLRPLDRDEGAALFLEVAPGPAVPVVMPVSAGELAWSGVPLRPAVLARWPMTPEAHPFSLDHLVAGQPTLPGTFGFEGTVRALLAACPGWAFVSGHDLFWGQFVRLQGSGELRVEAHLVEARPDQRRVRLRLLSDFVHASGTVLRRDIEHFAVTVVLRPTNPGIGLAPRLPRAQGQPTADPFCAPDASPVRLTGPFACVQDLSVGPGGQRAQWRVPDADVLQAVAHLTHPALLADAVCRVAMSGAGTTGDVPVPYRCRRFVVAPGINDTRLVTDGIDVRIAAAPCRREGDRRISAWALALDATTGETLLRLDGLVGRHATHTPRPTPRPTARRHSLEPFAQV